MTSEVSTETDLGLSPTAREALNHVSTATITTRLMHHGLRNTYLEGLSFSNPRRQRLVGEASTMRCIPAPEASLSAASFSRLHM